MGRSKGAVTGMEQLRLGRRQQGRVSAVSRCLKPPSLQPAPLQGLALQALWLVPPWAAAPSPHQLGARPRSAPQLPPRSHVLHMSCSWRGKRLFPAAFDLEAAWLDAPRHVTGSSSICLAALGLALGLTPAPRVHLLPKPSQGS